MATKTLITEAEFLRMTFDGPEADYVDGEIVERAVPKVPHSHVQGRFSVLFHPFSVTGHLFALQVLRIRTVARHFRTVDMVVYRDREPLSDIPGEAPFIAIEIVSPSDAHEELLIKLAEYKEIGVANVWVVHPGLRALSVFDNGSLLRVDAFALPEFGLRFTPADLF